MAGAGEQLLPRRLRRAILLGVSLGGAVALQEAPDDPRVAGVVAVATFSDLESIARDRAPFIARGGRVRQAFVLAEQEAHLRVADVSPVNAARRIQVPVLLVHGAVDHETRPVHSERVYAALAGPRQFLLVGGAGHNDALGRAWPEVEAWIEQVAGATEQAGTCVADRLSSPAGRDGLACRCATCQAARGRGAQSLNASLNIFMEASHDFLSATAS